MTQRANPAHNPDRPELTLLGAIPYVDSEILAEAIAELMPPDDGGRDEQIRLSGCGFIR